jgi:hypothetical protein
VHLPRWRLDFADGTFKAGPWASAGKSDSSRASKNLRGDLISASIEVKNVETRLISTIASVSAVNFKEFKWNFLHRVYANVHEVSGLELVTKNNGSVEILLDGSINQKPSGV